MIHKMSKSERIAKAKESLAQVRATNRIGGIPKLEWDAWEQIVLEERKQTSELLGASHRAYVEHYYFGKFVE